MGCNVSTGGSGLAGGPQTRMSNNANGSPAAEGVGSPLSHTVVDDEDAGGGGGHQHNDDFSSLLPGQGGHATPFDGHHPNPYHHAHQHQLASSDVFSSGKSHHVTVKSVLSSSPKDEHATSAASPQSPSSAHHPHHHHHIATPTSPIPQLMHSGDAEEHQRLLHELTQAERNQEDDLSDISEASLSTLSASNQQHSNRSPSAGLGADTLNVSGKSPNSRVAAAGSGGGFLPLGKQHSISGAINLQREREQEIPTVEEEFFEYDDIKISTDEVKSYKWRVAGRKLFNFPTAAAAGRGSGSDVADGSPAGGGGGGGRRRDSRMTNMNKFVFADFTVDEIDMIDALPPPPPKSSAHSSDSSLAGSGRPAGKRNSILFASTSSGSLGGSGSTSSAAAALAMALAHNNSNSSSTPHTNPLEIGVGHAPVSVDGLVSVPTRPRSLSITKTTMVTTTNFDSSHHSDGSLHLAPQQLHEASTASGSASGDGAALLSSLEEHHGNHPNGLGVGDDAFGEPSPPTAAAAGHQEGDHKEDEGDSSGGDQLQLPPPVETVAIRQQRLLDDSVRLHRRDVDLGIIHHCSVKTLVGHATRVKCFAIAPSEKEFVSCSNEDASVTLNNIQTGREIGIFTGHQDTVIHATFSHDGKYLATTSRDHTMVLWDVVTAKQLLTFDHAKVVICCVFSRDSKYVATGCQDKVCRLWETRRGRECLIFAQHEGIIISMSYAPDNAWIVSASADRTLRVWSTTTSKCRYLLAGHVGIVLACNYTNDGMFIVSNDEKLLKVWSMADGSCTMTLLVDDVTSKLGHFPPTGAKKLTWTLSCAAPGKFTKYFIVAANTRFLYVLDITTGDEVFNVYCKAPVYSLTSGVNSVVGFGDSFGNVYLLTLRN